MFPRRWLDIKGEKVPDIWQAAIRAVMGTIIFRPGILQVRFFHHELFLS
jgi:transcription factor C subunit 3